MLLGCPPNTKIIPDIKRITEAVMSEKGTLISCSNYGNKDADPMMCLHYNNGESKNRNSNVVCPYDFPDAGKSMKTTHQSLCKPKDCKTDFE